MTWQSRSSKLNVPFRRQGRDLPIATNSIDHHAVGFRWARFFNTKAVETILNKKFCFLIGFFFPISFYITVFLGLLFRKIKVAYKPDYTPSFNGKNNSFASQNIFFLITYPLRKGFECEPIFRYQRLFALLKLYITPLSVLACDW